MNAIILAAGLGSRFGDITKKTHKALLPIGNTANIERTIQYLIEFGITDIYIVVGYLADNFQYLKKKYNCHLIYNNYYNKFNNLFSFYVAKEYFSDTYMIDADVVFLNNFLEKHQYSTYYLINRTENKSEWIPILDKDQFVKKIDIASYDAPSLLGVSFWKKDDCILIKNKLKSLFLEKKEYENFANNYWDDIPKSIIHNMKIKTKLLNPTDAGEMDTLDNYLQIKELYNNSKK
ncbi:TPA: NTP transferase domain-containing protein [Proteus mirabilis]|uniref:Nucleotidyl transferase n=2 Tax=Proteus mirabilis TaxID=584 RepID=A0A385JMJ5_PROMI|nr:NTP transferase domain-containing protein [Proteus mirabilis]AXY99506.1 Nucleotidyl transferase [Proteus mirabilis]ELL8907119.1 NTP transferase domain-containing protein [Proteus mirabilis]MBB6620106.1 NTP transferase domain-containing protein [Proteus mirabilis]MBG2852029.1 NTP transferase domain-containing protein [Proteus mirabilis]MBL1399510.1 NTP transferase domain-containing protein [Proteus mirabilis]